METGRDESGNQEAKKGFNHPVLIFRDSKVDVLIVELEDE